MSLVLLGIHFKTAPLSAREQFYFVEEKLPEAYGLAKSMGLAPVILSTCNRTEIYVWGCPKIEILHEFVSEYHRKSIIPFLKNFYVKRGFRALDHLFETSCGLQSLVVGENQILSQLKKAYHFALSSSMVLPSELSRAFEFALACGKAARSQTSIGEGAMSLGSVTIDLLREIYEKDSEITIAVVGAGEIAEEILFSLKHYEKANIVILNRSEKNVKNLLAKFPDGDIKLEKIENIYHVIDQAHLIITSTSSQDFLIRKESLKKKCKLGKCTFFLDLSVPRNIDPEIIDLGDVILYTIDHLERIVEQNIKSRHMEFGEVKKIIDEKLNEWDQWRQSKLFSEILKNLEKCLSDEEKKFLWKNFKKMINEDKCNSSLDRTQMEDFIDTHLKYLRK